MAESQKLQVTKYFGGAQVTKMEMDIEDAKSHLSYFWTPEGGNNITVSVEGQIVKSYDELLALASQDKYNGKAFIEVGLFLSNDGYKSIWDMKR